MHTLNRKIRKKQINKALNQLIDLQVLKTLRNDQMRHLHGASDMAAQASEYFKKS